jgi:GrpB-like predicted nucleotidyltransferase (UPF0157 family)
MDDPVDEAVRSAVASDLEQVDAGDAPIEIVAYTPEWPARFDRERDRLAPLLPGVELHHIGSTAVPGLAAKPVIDMMAVVGDLDDPISALVDRGGYQFPAAYNATLSGRRWLCYPTPAQRTHHLHLVKDLAVLDRHLRFRDRLRTDSALRDEYAALKRRLAAAHRDDREGYTNAKASFIARAEGLPDRGT